MKKSLSAILICLLSLSVSAQIPDEVNDSIPSDSINWERYLDEITVSAQRPLIKVESDRIGYDVQGDADNKTETTLDMLRKVPMVSVDDQGNILVNGNSSYKIYKNGHPDPSLTRNAKEVLRSIPASIIKRIEVITEPGAREDAEGVNAILNIVFVENKNMSGLTGSTTLSYTSLNHPNFNSFLTGQIGKAIISFDYGYGGMSNKETSNIQTVDRMFCDSGDLLHVKSKGSNPGSIHFADINASYEIDSLNLLSASFGGYFYDLDVRGNANTWMTRSDDTPIYSYKSSYHMPDYNHHSWNGRMDYEHKTLRKGETLTFSYMMSLTRQRSVQENEYDELESTPFTYSGYTYRLKEHFTEHTFQGDWLRPFSDHHKLELGMKYIYRLNKSHSSQQFMSDLTYPETDMRFRHTTQVSAGYLDYTYNTEQLTLRAGLRYEHSYMKGQYPDLSHQDFSRHLSDWVPQLSLHYQFNDRHSLKLSYSSSISRPGIEYLNPGISVDPTVVEQGNPHLKSAQSKRLIMNYMYVGNNLTIQLAPSYTYSNNDIGMINTAKEGVRYYTYGNILHLRRWQVESYIKWTPFSGSTLTSNLNLSHTNSRNPDISIGHSGTNLFYHVSLSQKLPWNIRLTLNSYGSIGHSLNNIYAYEKSWFSYGFSLQRSFLEDDRLTVAIRGRNPFSKYNKYTIITDQGDYTGISYNWQRGRMFSISVSFRFGKQKASVKKTNTTIENDDVVGGISRN